MTSRKVVVIPDIHVPYHHEANVELAISECRGADHVVILGDLLDAYPLMSHTKNPARKHTMQDELDEANAILSKIRVKAGRNACIDLILGNHEDRLRRYIWQKAPALDGVNALDFEQLLHLDSRGINLHSPAGFRQYNARFKHGDIVRPQAGYTARAEMLKHRSTGFSGHTHRMGHAIQTDKEGRTTEWWECGHLVDTSKAEYVSSPDWQAGYVVLEVKADGTIHVQPVRL
jgi:predicted phosphodiesterase